MGAEALPVEGWATRNSGWAMSAAACVLLTASAGLALVTGNGSPPPGFSPPSSQAVGAVALLGVPILGAVLVSAPRAGRYGWWWCVLGFGFAVSWFAESWLTYAGESGRGSGVVSVAASLGDLGWVAAVSAMPFLLLYFPTGRPPSVRWRPVVVVLLLAAASAVVGVLLLPGEASIAPVSRAVVTSAVPGLGLGLTMGGVGLLLLGVPVALASLVVRYRSAAAAQRVQIKWVTYAAAVFALSLVLLTWWDAPGLWDTVLESLPLVWLYVAVGVAVLRHRVVDVDLLINRSLVYAVLSAGLSGAYIVVVGLLSLLFDTWLSLPIAIVGAAIVTVVFQPLRERVQRSVNRMLYGHRDDPFAVVSHLARTLETAIPAEEVLPTVVATAARALRLEHASIWQYGDAALHLAAHHGNEPPVSTVSGAAALARLLGEGGPYDVAALTDQPTLHDALTRAGATLIYPLQHRGVAVGLLCVGPRGGRDGWSRQDLATLGDLAVHVGAAVHTTSLADDLRRSLVELQRSRELLLVSQEQERRRIQRDLHDGLGPTLAAVRLHLEACLTPTTDLPPRTRATLERVDELVAQAGDDVRRLVTGLHPPQVAEHGLAAALATHIDEFGRDVGITTQFHTAPHGLTVPAPVEVGVFRVAQEALTNVAKHARANRVHVTLTHEGRGVRLVVRDDGRGLPSSAGDGGTGLNSMAERAAMLGGSLRVSNHVQGGTEVALDVPLESPP